MNGMGVLRKRLATLCLIAVCALTVLPAAAAAETAAPADPPAIVFPVVPWVTDDPAPEPVVLAPEGSVIRLTRSGDIAGTAAGGGETGVPVALSAPLPVGVHYLKAEYVTGGETISAPADLPPIVVVPALPLSIGGTVAAANGADPADRELAGRLLSLIAPTSVESAATDGPMYGRATAADNGDLTSAITVSVADRFGAPVTALTHDRVELRFGQEETFVPGEDEWTPIADGVYKMTYGKEDAPAPFSRTADVHVDGVLMTADLTVEAGYHDIPPLADTVTADTYLTLPAFVPAFLRDGTELQAPVFWEDALGNPVTVADISAAGTYTYLGTVFGYDEVVPFTLTVNAAQAPYIVRIPELTHNTVTGDVYYTLPSFVTAEWSDGGVSSEPVVWRDDTGSVVTAVPTNRSGTYDYYGTVAGYADAVVFTLTVTDEFMYRIVLTWNEIPRDLDSHLFGSLPEGPSFHVYYGDMIFTIDDKTIAVLERDDTDGDGPETSTIAFEGVTGTYRFIVHLYSWWDGTLPDSGAFVKLYRGDEAIAEFDVASAVPAEGVDAESARYWNVFELADGELFPVMLLENDMAQQ